MRQSPTMQMLLAATSVLLLANCSSSGPCQATFAGLSCGDCLIPGNFSRLCQPLTPSAAQQTACQSACGSSADQAALSNYVSCVNKIPAAAGTCSLLTETAWLTSVGGAVLGCLGTDGGQPSQACVTGYIADILDGG